MKPQTSSENRNDRMESIFTLSALGQDPPSGSYAFYDCGTPPLAKM